MRLASSVTIIATILSLAWTGVAAASPDDNDESIDAIVDSIVQAYGGRAAMDKLGAFRLEGTIVAHVRGFAGRVVRDYQGPDRLRVQLVYPQQTEVRILAGAESWRGDADAVVPVQGPPRQAMVYQLLRATLPIPLDVHRQRLTLTGKGTWNGASTIILHLGDVEGVAMNYWIDDATRRVVKVDGHFQGGAMFFEFGTEYDDFRDVDGVSVAFHEENYANGAHTGTTTLDRITFGPDGLGPFGPTPP